MRLLVIRHAEQELPRAPAFEDPPLSTVGRRQARRLAYALRERILSRVVSSNMVRALQTARPIASSLRVPLVAEPQLAEISMGDLPHVPAHLATFWRLRCFGPSDCQRPRLPVL